MGGGMGNMGGNQMMGGGKKLRKQQLYDLWLRISIADIEES